MDESKGEVLLVGEGDFSFTVAFTRRLNNKCLINITSSSLLERQELFDLHQAGPENVEIIKKLGVNVLFEVDATKLKANESLKGKKFDRIIFNFPHIGGKSNIKKNRQLLKDFFNSAVEMLKEEGDILLSLCRGQGGTPVDQPVRAWHDSWQAVAMAAYVDLILYRFTDFDPVEWPEYSCTGFRSRDQHFYMGEAITYFFKRSYTVQVFDSDNVEFPVQCRVGEDLIEVNRYIAEKLQRNLLSMGEHPLHYITQELQRSFNTQFGTDMIIDTGNVQQKIVFGSLLWEKVAESIKSEDKPEKNCNLVRNCGAAVKDYYISDDSSTNVTYIEGTRRVNICPYYTVKKSGVLEQLKLRTSLLDCGTLVKILSNSESIITACGDVYKRTWPSPDDLPAQHEFVALIPESGTNQLSQPALTNKVCDVLKVVMPNADIHLTNSEVHKLSVWYQHYFEDVQCIEVGYKSVNAFHKTSCNQVSAKGAASVPQQGHKVTKLSKVIGYIGKLRTGDVPLLKDKKVKSTALVILSLDSITQVRFDIQSKSLLWCDKSEFFNQFRNVSADDRNVSFQTISHFPPLWRHDLSFWEKSDEILNEQRFIDIVRNIAGDSITEMILMNVWRDPESDKISKCYRQIYQSFDAALSHAKAHDFQNAVRLKVSKIFGVDLR